MMSEFSESQGLVENYKPEDREELIDLREELRVQFWRLAKENLTERQFEVLHLLSLNFTQTEIAKMLHVNQSSITKSVHGNCDYRNKGNGKVRKVYGGSKKRLVKLANQDLKVKELREKIAEIHSQYSD